MTPFLNLAGSSAEGRARGPIVWWAYAVNAAGIGLEAEAEPRPNTHQAGIKPGLPAKLRFAWRTRNAPKDRALTFRHLITHNPRFFL